MIYVDEFSAILQNGQFLNYDDSGNLTLNITRCYYSVSEEDINSYKCRNEIAVEDDYYCIGMGKKSSMYYVSNNTFNKLEASTPGMYWNQVDYILSTSDQCVGFSYRNQEEVNEKCDSNPGIIKTSASATALTYCIDEENSFLLTEQNYGIYYHPYAFSAAFIYDFPKDRSGLIEFAKNRITRDGAFTSSFKDSDIFGVHLYVKNDYTLEEGTFGKDSGSIYLCDYSKCTKLYSSYYYYQQKNNNNEVVSRSLYYCDDTGMCAMVNSVVASEYYLVHSATIVTERVKVDGKSIYSITVKKYLLECTDTSLGNCSMSDTFKLTSSSYYIFDALKNSQNLVLIKKTNDGYGKGEIGKDTGTYYVCEDSKCVLPKSTYFLYQNQNNNKLFYFSSTGESLPVIKPIDGYYSSYLSTTSLTTYSTGIVRAVVSNQLKLIRCNYHDVNSCVNVKSSKEDLKFSIISSRITEKSSSMIIIPPLANGSSTYSEGSFGTNQGSIYNCENSLCMQLKSTYYLYEKGNFKYLYYCDDLGSCNIVNSISIGYYLNQMQSSGSTKEDGVLCISTIKVDVIIQCKKESTYSCFSIEYPEDDELPIFTVIDNTIALSPKVLLLIFKEDKQIDYSYYDEGEFGKDSGLIFDCKNSQCAQMISTYYLYESSSSSSSSSSTKGKKYLYDCDDSGNCTVKTSCEVGFYLGGSSLYALDSITSTVYYSDLIQCNSKSIDDCEIVTVDNSGYYFPAETNSNAKSRLIGCTKSNCYYIEPSVYKTTYYIDGGNSQKLIKCSEYGCSSELNKSMAIYLSNTGATSEQVIVCNPKCSYQLSQNTPCNEYDDMGNLFYSQNGLYICDGQNWKPLDYSGNFNNYGIVYNDLIYNLFGEYFNTPNYNEVLYNVVSSDKIEFYSNPTSGYYINKYENMYIQCESTGCRSVQPYDNCDSDESIGHLALIISTTKTSSSNIYICTKNYSGNKISIDSSNIYRIEKGFPGAENGVAVVQIRDFSAFIRIGTFFDVREDDKGNEHIGTTITKCSIKNSVYQCQEEKANSNDYYYDEENSELYYMEDNELKSMDEKLPGYYVNHNEVIIIEPNLNSTSSSHLISPLNQFSKCSEESTGRVFTDGSTPSLCLDGKNSVALTEKNEGLFIISPPKDNFFEIPQNFYGLVNISENKVTLNTTNQETEYCVNNDKSVSLSDKCDKTSVTCTFGICKDMSSTNNDKTSNSLRNIPNYLKSMAIAIIAIIIINIYY